MEIFTARNLAKESSRDTFFILLSSSSLLLLLLLLLLFGQWQKNAQVSTRIQRSEPSTEKFAWEVINIQEFKKKCPYANNILEGLEFRHKSIKKVEL